MTRSSARLLLWAPRVLGIATCLFVGLFALDAFSGRPMREALADFAIHVIPALVLLLIVALSWRWEWIAGITFLAFAALYAVTMARGRMDWIVVISGPLSIVGALFLWSWHYHGELHTMRKGG
jgi:hypothetical protein